MSEINRFLGTEKLSISEAMKDIDLNGCGILFLIDDKNRLVGCVTDGDIRRYLLSGGKMTDSVAMAANKVPRIARTGIEAKALYHQKNYIAIPVVNDTGIIVDIYHGETEQEVGDIITPLEVPVVINAGGRGTRLDPYTRILPKPLIPIGELPIIELIIQEFCKYKCNDIHIIVNYKKELLKAYFADNENNYKIKWYDEKKPLGTGGGLSLLKGNLNSTFIFTNCDTLIKSDYEKALRFHKDHHNAITMICAYKDISIPYGVVETGTNGIIEEMKEKPMISFLTNTGMYIVEPEVINEVDDNTPIGFPDIIKKVMAKGGKVAAYPISENEWLDMGQINELEKMRVKLFGE